MRKSSRKADAAKGRRSPLQRASKSARAAGEWFVYMIRCGDDSLYTGTASDVPRRFAEHQSQGKKCARYLRGKAPIRLVFCVEAGDRAAACRFEAAIKKLPRKAKKQIAAGGIAALSALQALIPAPRTASAT